MKEIMEHRLILDNSFWSIVNSNMNKTSLDLLSSLKLQSSSKGLLLENGLGEFHKMISQKLFKSGKIIHVDNSYLNVEALSEINCEFDFIYLRNFLSTISEPLLFLERLLTFLSNGGSVLIEEMNFKNIYFSPSNFYSNKYLEILDKFSTKKRLDFPIGKRLHKVLEQYMCSNVKSKFQAPRFLFGKSRKAISEILKGIKMQAIELDILTEEEFVTLINELMAIENSSENMISIPGIYQISASYFKK